MLEVIYLIFNEGYAATAGEDWMRPALCDEALRLGRILAELTPTEGEVHGLVALHGNPGIAYLAPRTDATGRTDPAAGTESRAMESAADPARACRPPSVPRHWGLPLGPYALQAAIAACHARAKTNEDTDWARIVALYASLAQLSQSPVVELNRAVAVSMAFGPVAALELVDELTQDNRLKAYHLLPSVRADLLQKLGRFEEARMEFTRAAALAQNGRERTLLLGRAAVCGTTAQ